MRIISLLIFSLIFVVSNSHAERPNIGELREDLKTGNGSLFYAKELAKCASIYKNYKALIGYKKKPSQSSLLNSSNWSRAAAYQLIENTKFDTDYVDALIEAMDAFWQTRLLYVLDNPSPDKSDEHHLSLLMATGECSNFYIRPLKKHITIETRSPTN